MKRMSTVDLFHSGSTTEDGRLNPLSSLFAPAMHVLDLNAHYPAKE